MPTAFFAVYLTAQLTFNSTLAVSGSVVAGASAPARGLFERFRTPEFPAPTMLKPLRSTRRNSKRLTIKKVQFKVTGYSDFLTLTEVRCSRKKDFVDNSLVFRSYETLLSELFDEEFLFFVILAKTPFFEHSVRLKCLQNDSGIH
jgi:hypothetical protein